MLPNLYVFLRSPCQEPAVPTRSHPPDFCCAKSSDAIALSIATSKALLLSNCVAEPVMAMSSHVTQLLHLFSSASASVLVPMPKTCRPCAFLPLLGTFWRAAELAAPTLQQEDFEKRCCIAYREIHQQSSNTLALLKLFFQCSAEPFFATALAEDRLQQGQYLAVLAWGRYG